MVALLSLLGVVACACRPSVDPALLPEPADAPAAAPAAPTAAAPTPDAAPTSPPPPAVPAGPRGEAPLYVLPFTHHFLGTGGYYPDAAVVRATAQACVDAQAPCTLFFDGLLAHRLASEDPGLAPWLRAQGLPIGYHGEEAHGPYPVVVGVEELGSADRQGMLQVARDGWSFAQTVEAIHDRYTHGFLAPQWGADGYLRRGTGGDSDRARPGGIALVEDWLQVEPVMFPAHALFQPAALFAFSAEAPGMLLQGAGPFSPHFLKSTRNPALIQATTDFLGRDTSLFWFMGHLVQRGDGTNEIPMWSTAGLVRRGGPGGGSEQRPDGARPPRGDGQGPPPGRRPAGGRPGDGQLRGGGASSGGGGLDQGAPGEATRRAFAGLDRSVPRVVLVSIDGTGQDVADYLAWLRQEQARDPSIVLVGPQDLYSRVEPPQVTASAVAVARAVQAQWTGVLPDHLEVEGQPLSHADAFEILVRALAGEGDTITTAGVNGPVGHHHELAIAAGQVEAEAVRAAAAGVRQAIADSPYAAIPTSVQVGGQAVGFHQYYALMAQVVGGATGRLDLPQRAYAPSYAGLLAQLLGRDVPDQTFWMECQFWTAKPVTWRQP